MTDPVLIAKEHVPVVLQIIGADIEKLMAAFHAGSDSYANVVQGLYEEKRQLWILATEDHKIQGWLITYLEPKANGKRLVLDLFGGENLEEIVAKWPWLETWAYAHGATEMLAFSRPGLRKKLKRLGFHHVCDLVIKPLIGTHL